MHYKQDKKMELDWKSPADRMEEDLRCMTALTPEGKLGSPEATWRNTGLGVVD